MLLWTTGGNIIVNPNGDPYSCAIPPCVGRFAVITVAWGAGSGRDLDMNVYVNGVKGNAGYGMGDPGECIVWGGDNTSSSGSETFSIDTSCQDTDRITVSVMAGWWGEVGPNPVSVSIDWNGAAAFKSVGSLSNKLNTAPRPPTGHVHIATVVLDKEDRSIRVS